MNATSADRIAKCPCNHCNGKIEFDIEHAGKAISCPHCGMETLLFIPQLEEPPKPNKPLPSLGPAGKWVLISLVAFSLLCFLAYKIATSQFVQQFAAGSVGIIAGLIIVVILLIWAALWILFPVFVYFALERMKSEAARTNQLLARIESALNRK